MKFSEAFFFIGRPLGPVYGLAMDLRAKLYSSGRLPVTKLRVPVISVGNLTMGGTGKTPTVMMLARHFQNRGFRPAIISRGYRGKAREDVNIVSDGKTTMLDAEAAGDEPYMMASTLSGVPVLTGRKRSLPCLYAIKEFAADLLILDDGFQHLAVERSCDIVLFNGTTLAGDRRIFPGGALRESMTALKRADIIVLTGITDDNRAQAEHFTKQLVKHLPATPVCRMTNRVDGLFSAEGTEVHMDQLPMPLYAFSGIAHPERFRQQLQQAGIELAGHTDFQDHIDYSPRIISQLNKMTEKTRAKAFITTQKDIVKLHGQHFSLPLYYQAISPIAPPELISFLDAKYSPAVSD